MLSSHLIVLWWLMLWDIKRADGALWCSSSCDHGICMIVWAAGVGVLSVPQPGLRRCDVGEKWGPYGGGGKERGEVLMGNRQMACQCQKWSCAEERVGKNEREDGRRAWLINLFTSLKMLRAPFWLKFSLSSIIAMASLNLQSCRYQVLSKRLSLQTEPPPHPPTANLLPVASFASPQCSTCQEPTFLWFCSLSYVDFVCVSLFICSFHFASKLIALKTHWEWCLYVSARFLKWSSFPTQGF